MDSHAAARTAGTATPRGLTNLRFKVIGLILVALSCVGGFVFPQGLQGFNADEVNMGDLTAAVLCEVFSWIAVPVYAWLLVEGYRHTRSVGRYLARLVVLALVAEVPYDLATSGQVVDFSSQNPVWALAVTLFVLWVIDAFVSRPRAQRVLVAIVVTLFAVLWMLLGRVGVRQQLVNEGVLILALALIYRFMAARENTMMITAAMLSACFGIFPALGVALVHYHNGLPGYDRETKPWTSWMFYVLYPVMLLVFGLAAVL